MSSPIIGCAALALDSNVHISEVEHQMPVILAFATLSAALSLQADIPVDVKILHGDDDESFKSVRGLQNPND